MNANAAGDGQALRRILRRGVSDIIVESEFVERLGAGKPLRLKMGFDPSATDIHLGHAVGLRKLRQLQDIGHKVVLIVGDWTAQIGDPSGKSATRPMLTAEQVRANAETYMAQFFKIVDREKTETRWQTEWFGKFSLTDVIGLTGRFTVAQFLARDDFAKRFGDNQPIAITELLYPLLQAYDSVAIEADVEFGGTDQMFNLLVGRDLQRMVGQTPQQCFLMPLLPGTDGVEKMSKSLGNYIGIDEPPNDIYGKTMSLPDRMIIPYFEYLTDVSDEDLAEMRQALDGADVNPMDLKKRLARELVGQFYDGAAARAAERHFERTVQGGGMPDDVEEAWVSRSQIRRPRNRVIDPNTLTEEEVLVDIAHLLTLMGLAKSVSEGRRLAEQGGVRFDGKGSGLVETGTHRRVAVVKDGTIIQRGSRSYKRLRLRD